MKLTPRLRTVAHKAWEASPAASVKTLKLCSAAGACLQSKRAFLKNIVVALVGVLMMSQASVAQTYSTDFGDGGTITVVSLKRSGSDSVILKAVVENKGLTTLKIETLLNRSSDWKEIFRATLQDPVARKEYQQVLIDKKAVGSEHDKRDTVPPHGKLNVWARITAPPAGVDKITVVFGGAVAPIEDVPLQ
jgi:hypothetical protein